MDDEPAAANLAAIYLERIHEDMSVAVETAVTAALYRVKHEAFDCVVSDFNMPEMDGLAFFEAVRDINPDLPFILFTRKGSEEIASETLSAGVIDYLQKSTEIDQYELLATRVGNAIEKRR